MFLANKLNKGAGAAAAPADPQFNYVTMLLHGDGTNGAQNNTFLDSSTNNFTITRNGNTTQGSFSPYGSNWSNYFDGNGDYLGFPNSGAFTFSTGDFTVEAWIYRVGTGTGTSVYESIIGGNTSSTAFWNLYVNSSNNTISWFGNDSVIRTTSNTITNNNWNHIAVSRSSGTLKIFINGVQGYSASVSTSYSLGSGGGNVGFDSASTGNKYFFGYISNIRVVNGTAVYTSAFTPSATPLTAITNTSLLTCQSNRFIDNSGYAFTLIANGTPSVQRFNPFGTSTAYSTSVIGGSGYFDGSGDYLNTSANATQFGTGNFTIEFWIYFNAVNNSTTKFIFDMRNAGATSASFLAQEASDNWTFWNGAGTSIGTGFTSSTFKLSNWTHVAISRSSGVTKFFFNGTQTNSVADTSNYATSTLAFGARYTGSDFLNAYVSDLRLVKGTALYTSSFTPPTAPLTAVTNTSLLLKYTNGAIFDNAMMNNLETVGNAQISTSVKKYGTGSIAFDGTGDYLVAPNNPAYLFNTGDFTVELFYYPTVLAGAPAYNQHLVGMWGGGTSQVSWLLYYSQGNLYWYTSTNGSTVVASITAASTLSINNWYHIALVRSSGTTKIYLNGTSVGSTATVVNLFNANCTLTIGYNPVGGTPDYIYGYVDELRISKGYARYTANFTPPTAALPDTGPV